MAFGKVLFEPRAQMRHACRRGDAECIKPFRAGADFKLGAERVGRQKSRSA
jgi:hypothetical protein